MAQIIRNVQFLLYGSKHFSKAGYARASKTFDASIMERKLTGKTVVVTGANQGIGLQTSEDLARRGATLLMVCRNAERGQAAVDLIKSKTGNQDVHLKVCDLSSLASVRSFASELQASGQKVHVLVNNAGVMVHDGSVSADGYDINYATNTLGTWLLTQLLEGVLKASAPAKVIFVSSGGMLTQKLEVSVPASGQKHDGMVMYSQDKRRQAVMAERFAELWAASGWTETEGVKKSIAGFFNFYKDKFRPLSEGADTIVYLALQDDDKLEQGGFYLDRSAQVKHLSLGNTQYTRDQVDQLWHNLSKAADKVLAAPAS